MANIVDRYYDWLLDLVFDIPKMKREFSKVLYILFITDYVWEYPMDSNRESHVFDFRYRFGYENGYSDAEVRAELDDRPASMLELMVELSVRIEETIMQDSIFGDRKAIWFWDMMESLGLDDYPDYDYDEQAVIDILDCFMRHEYEPNGKGGLFTLNHPYDDMRNVTIWCQANWYLDEKINEG